MTLRRYTEQRLNHAQYLYAKHKISGLMLQGITRAPRHITLRYHLQDPTMLKKMTKAEFQEDLALVFGVKSVATYRDLGTVLQKISLPRNYWQECLFSSTQGAGVGFGDDNKQIEFDFDVPHALVAGTTGSGKSVATNALALAIFRAYPNARFLFLDPHNEFKQWRNFENLVQPIANSLEDIATGMEWLYQTYLTRRNNDIRDADPVICFIDEAEEIITGELNEKLTRLTSGGRKYRMHVIVSTQKPTEKTLSGVLSNLGQKYVGLVTSARISSDLTGFKQLNCHKLNGQGEFVRVKAGQIDYFQFGNVLETDFDMLPRGSHLESPTTVNVSRFKSTRPPVGKVGRPRNILKPDLIGEYLFAILTGNDITRSQARQALNISRHAHDQYTQAAYEIIGTIQLKERNLIIQ